MLHSLHFSRRAGLPDPAGAREKGVLGPNVIGHGSASGSVFRIDRDHDLVVVVGRNQFKDYTQNDAWAARFMTVLASGLGD
jgi:CubicO group peptidase (beta-lactamase class C family)